MILFFNFMILFVTKYLLMYELNLLKNPYIMQYYVNNC